MVQPGGVDPAGVVSVAWLRTSARLRVEVLPPVGRATAVKLSTESWGSPGKPVNEEPAKISSDGVSPRGEYRESYESKL